MSTSTLTTQPEIDVTQHYQLSATYDSEFVVHYSPGYGSRKWRDVRELGRGGFGVVKAQTETSTKQMRAVKTIMKREIPPQLEWKREIVAMATLAKFAQFVEFLGWYENDDYVAIVMELIEHGDLAGYLNHRPKPESEAREISWQILNGLEVMHRYGFAHRDLKPANIFISSPSPNLVLKIGDFGISKRILTAPSPTGTLLASTHLRTRVYTPDYAAPEVVQNEAGPDGEGAYTSAVDLWALGCITYQVLIGRTPFSNPFALFRYCNGEKGVLMPIDRMGHAVGEFVGRLLEPDGQKRPSAEEARWLPWVAELSHRQQEELRAAEEEQRRKVEEERRKAEEEERKKEVEEVKTQFQELSTKYKNVKRLYFDGRAEIEALQAEVERLKTELSDSQAKALAMELIQAEFLASNGKPAEGMKETQEVEDLRAEVRALRKELDETKSSHLLQGSGLTAPPGHDDVEVQKELDGLKEDHSTLTAKYRKVKALYFEGTSEIETLQARISELESSAGNTSSTSSRGFDAGHQDLERISISDIPSPVSNNPFRNTSFVGRPQQDQYYPPPSIQTTPSPLPPPRPYFLPPQDPFEYPGPPSQESVYYPPPNPPAPKGSRFLGRWSRT